MPDRILTILGRFRRRMLAARAAEAAAVAGSAGGLAAAFLMAARILEGRYPLAALALSAAPLAAGLVLALSARLRAWLTAAAALQWTVTLFCALSGLTALVCLAGGAFEKAPKDLIFVLLPAGALAGAVAAMLRPASLQRVAVGVDLRAGLGERLSTALELHEAGEESAFASAVRDQAVAAAEAPKARRVRFWDRSSATLGALGLAVTASVLMLPWEPLESPEAVARQRWRQVAGPAGAGLMEQLPLIQKLAAAALGDVAGQLRQLEKLAGTLRAASPREARQWRGKVVELDRIADALRRAVAAGQIDAAMAEQVSRVLRAIEQAAADIAEGMDPEGVGPARTGNLAVGPDATPTGTGGGGPSGAAGVIDPAYTNLATLPATGPDGSGGGVNVAIGQTPFDRAWAEARQRAAEAITRGDIPPQYRPLVRDFFATK